jgi:cell division protein FtsL
MDPITIGLAFAAAQSAVGHIKQAIALGKDINSLAGQFSKFFQSSDAIHRERSKVTAKASRLGKTDAELGHEALQIAMHSDALRQAERELKDMILWQLGKPQIWEQMIKERTRLFKERAEAEREEEARQLAHKKKIAEQIMFGMYFVAFSVVIFAIIMMGIGIYGAMEEKRIYDEKVAKRNLIIRQQQRERDVKERAERDKAIGG